MSHPSSWLLDLCRETYRTAPGFTTIREFVCCSHALKSCRSSSSQSRTHTRIDTRASEALHKRKKAPANFGKPCGTKVLKHLTSQPPNWTPLSACPMCPIARGQNPRLSQRPRSCRRSVGKRVSEPNDIQGSTQENYSTVDSKTLENGPRRIYAGCPSSGGFGVGGQSYSNLLASTVGVLFVVYLSYGAEIQCQCCCQGTAQLSRNVSCSSLILNGITFASVGGSRDPGSCLHNTCSIIIVFMQASESYLQGQYLGSPSLIGRHIPKASKLANSSSLGVAPRGLRLSPNHA